MALRTPLLTLLLVCAGVATAAAQATAFPPEGELRSKGSNALLAFQKTDSGAWRFSIESVSDAGNLCQFEGHLDGRLGMVGADGLGEACQIEFTPDRTSVHVRYRTNEACRTWCGLNATGEGIYTLVPPGCDPASVRRARAGASALHRARRHEDARAALEPLLERCGPVLPSHDEAWIRNDLAIALYRLGMASACIDALRPVDWLLRSSTYDPEAVMPALQRDVMRGLVGATTFNWAACETSLPAGPRVADGVHVDAGATSEVEIRTGDDGRRRISVQSVIALGHVCELDGVLDGSIARGTPAFEFPPCLLRLGPAANGFELEELTPSACRPYCGSSSSFGGVHTPRPTACTPDAIADARARYRRLYDAGTFIAALGVLEPVLDLCKDTLPLGDDAWIRNDLAVSYKRLDRLDRCREVLAPLSNLVLDADGEPIAYWPPVSKSLFERQMRATTANWLACGAERPVNTP